MRKQKQRKKPRSRQRAVKLEIKLSLRDINYKNVGLLQKYLNSRFKILPRKYTKLSSKLQRRLAQEIKKARNMALLKYTDRH